MYRTVVSSACLVLALPAFATDIYRCVDTQGRVEYRDEPCSRAAGQTGALVTLPPLNFVRQVDQAAVRPAQGAPAAGAAREGQGVGTATIPSGAMPLWQVPGGLPLPDTPAINPKPPIPTPTPQPPASLPANATSTAAAAAMGNPALPPATPPKAPPSLPVNATSAAAAGATGVAGK